jgi:hypothetical protein
LCAIATPGARSDLIGPINSTFGTMLIALHDKDLQTESLGLGTSTTRRVQRIGCRGGDRNLLSVAAWLTDVAPLNIESSHEQA